MKNIVLIGSGNVATHLGLSLLHKGYIIKQVWSNHRRNANILAKRLNSRFIDNLKDIKDADLYIVTVKDDALESVIEQLDVNNIIHTSGGNGLDVFDNKCENYGVFYPLQTFNKDVNLDFSKTPLCIEANNKFFENKLIEIGSDLSNTVVRMDSEQRKKLHIAAVFACNFTNHMFTIADTMLERLDINFKILMPIIHQTVLKLEDSKPSKVQTGPAIRKDRKMIQNHISNLPDKETKEIYKLISESIMAGNG